ncbi:hypothetical protein LTR53_002646 [Teratosphaeriaceae sp. CCFEE 6253]|nr:hypothetical protein LTR53_002646 [Teratosphaeriaceae sp. CCFEE 6253]
MSIIERSNPLNLQYRVCIVTSASSPLGVVICKTLLKANAFVLGIDTLNKDASLNAGRGTHFQFLQCGVHEAGAAERIVDAARVKFDGIEGIDVLVNLPGSKDENLVGLSQAVKRVMVREGRGSIVSLLGDDDQADAAAVHCNIIRIKGEAVSTTARVKPY